MSLLENTTCLICHTNSNITLTLPCRCNQTCIDCLGQWVFSRISPTQCNGLDQKIPCPVSVCQKEFTILQIYPEMPESEKARINEALLKAYLNREPNVLKCPKQGCEYAVLVDIPSCSKDLECGLCHTKWGDKGEGFTSEEETGFFKKLLRKLRNTKNEVFTFFWKTFKAKKCPGCKVLISRVPEGCKMMTCTQCKCQFCWFCLKDGQSCDHAVKQDDYRGEPGPSFGMYMAVGMIWSAYLVGWIGVFWMLKAIGCWTVSGLISLFA